MSGREEPPRQRLSMLGWMAMLVLCGASFGVQAQDASQAAPEAAPTEQQAPATDEAAGAVEEEASAADEEETAEVVEGALSAEELQALVAPIALYPDLVLVVTLQAALAPLDIVQADRFLDQYAEDPSLEPDPGWDESVIGLLNYPSVIDRMSGDLDWTQSLGTAVLDQLEGVQDAIQEFRAFMRAIGALESNEQATVIAEDDIIRIEPTDENAVYIPQYDPDALLAALYSTGGEASAGTEGEAVAGEEMVESETQEVVTETVEGAAAAPAAEVVPAAAPAYYNYPAVAPPPVTYSDPSPSWLGTAATFAGGAVVGGLVGWAIADDDDDHDHNNNGGDSIKRGNVNIEDSTIVVNRGGDGRGNDLERRAQNERLKRDARDKAQREQTKRELNQRYADRPGAAQTRSSGERKVAGLSTSGPREATPARSAAGDKQLAARVDQAKTKAAPGGREATRVAPAKSSKTAARVGDSKPPQAASAFGGGKSASEAKRDSDRGVASRSRAKTEVRPSRSPASGGAFAQHGGGGGKAASKDRGQKSRRGKR